eukprot:4367722-Amphidinium_carterae.1
MDHFTQEGGSFETCRFQERCRKHEIPYATQRNSDQTVENFEKIEKGTKGVSHSFMHTATFVKELAD